MIPVYDVFETQYHSAGDSWGYSMTHFMRFCGKSHLSVCELHFFHRLLDAALFSRHLSSISSFFLDLLLDAALFSPHLSSVFSYFLDRLLDVAKVTARLDATLEGFERQLTMQQSYDRRQAALERYRLEYEGPTCKTDDIREEEIDHQ